MNRQLKLPRILRETIRCSQCDCTLSILPLFFAPYSYGLKCWGCCFLDEGVINIDKCMITVNNQMKLTVTKTDLEDDIAGIGAVDGSVFILKLFKSNDTILSSLWCLCKRNCEKKFEIKLGDELFEGANIFCNENIKSIQESNGFVRDIPMSQLFSKSRTVTLGIRISQCNLSDQYLTFNNNLIKQLVCPICKEYLIAPVYQCNIGHSICYLCKENITSCKVCCLDVSDTKNTDNSFGFGATANSTTFPNSSGNANSNNFANAFGFPTFSSNPGTNLGSTTKDNNGKAQAPGFSGTTSFNTTGASGDTNYDWTFRPTTSNSTFGRRTKFNKFTTSGSFDSTTTNVNDPAVNDAGKKPAFGNNTMFSGPSSGTFDNTTKNKNPSNLNLAFRTRNFALENVLNVVVYPCKYTKYNCTFMGVPLEIKDHESRCGYGPYECPLTDCKWEGQVSDMVGHVKNKHADNLRCSKHRIISNFDPNKMFEFEFVDVVDHNLFKINCKYARAEFIFQVIIVDRSKTGFYFTLTFTDSSGKNSACFTKECASLKDENLPEKSLIIPLMTMKAYMEWNKLKFDLNISK